MGGGGIGIGALVEVAGWDWDRSSGRSGRVGLGILVPPSGRRRGWRRVRHLWRTSAGAAHGAATAHGSRGLPLRGRPKNNTGTNDFIHGWVGVGLGLLLSIAEVAGWDWDNVAHRNWPGEGPGARGGWVGWVWDKVSAEVAGWGWDRSLVFI